MTRARALVREGRGQSDRLRPGRRAAWQTGFSDPAARLEPLAASSDAWHWLTPKA